MKMEINNIPLKNLEELLYKVIDFEVTTKPKDIILDPFLGQGQQELLSKELDGIILV